MKKELSVKFSPAFLVDPANLNKDIAFNEPQESKKFLAKFEKKVF